MGKRLLALALALVTTQWLFFSTNPNTLGYPTPPFFGTLGFAIFIVATHIALYLIFSLKLKQKSHKYALFTTAAAIVSAGLAFTKGSFIDQFLLGIMSVSTTFITIYLLALTHSSFGAISEVVAVPFVIAFNWYKSVLTSLQNIWLTLTIKNTPKMRIKNTTAITVILGVIITIPVILVLVGLLSSADPIFSKLISNLFSLEWFRVENWVIIRTIALVLTAIIVLPFFSFKIKERFVSRLGANSNLGKLPGVAYILSLSVLTVISLFLVIQFKYLFANVAETELIQFGVQTYSEYVRRGFSELLLVSVVIYLVSGFSFVVYRSAKQASALQLINFLLLSEAAIFVLSIFRRIYLYQSLHGFTRVRIYGGAFLILMIVLTAILALRHLKPKAQWYIYELLATFAFVFIITGISVDTLITNYSPPTVNGEVDYVYISRLSADAADGWLAAYSHTKDEVDKIAAKPEYTNDDKRKIIYAYQSLNHIKYEYEYLAWKNGKPIGPPIMPQRLPTETKQRNLSESRAFIKLQERISIDELNSTIGKAQVLYNQIHPNEYQNLIDRGMDSPLVN